ncbi:MAG TPA: FecR family protein [Tenuifilaceae bacterium]|nr:FecR family protein [Tenuifilaceae bacterium]
MTEKQKNINRVPEDFDRLFELKGLHVPFSNRSKDDAWEMLMKSIEEQDDKPKVVSLFTDKRVWVAAATVAVLVAVSWFYMFTARIEFVTGIAQTLEVKLPDSSRVMMNENSRLEFPKYYKIAGRKATLNGEAFFEVKKGSKFTVFDSLKREVTVLGTEFNVYSRDSLFRVECYVGKVSVKTDYNKNVILFKGETLQEEGEKVVKKKLPSLNSVRPAWVTGDIAFENSKLSDVFTEIERQFNISIKVENFNPDTRYYTGVFSRSDLNIALTLVTLPMNLSYTINPDSTIVTIFEKQ